MKSTVIACHAAHNPFLAIYKNLFFFHKMLKQIVSNGGMTTIITIAYIFMTGLSLYGYWPQIKLLLTSPGPAKDLSLQTWSIWALEGVVGLAYGIYHLEDAVFIAVAAADVLLMAVIAALLLCKRYMSVLQDRSILSFIGYHSITPAE